MSPVLENVLYIYDLIRPYLDFGVIAVLIYCLLYFLRGTRGASVLAGCVIALIFLTLLTNVLKFEVLNWLLENFWTIASVALVVIFQPELRRAFAQLGSKSFAHHANVQKRTIRETVSAVTQMSRSLTSLSRRRVGALIVFERQIGMATFKNSAVHLEAKVSSLLLQSIFYPNSPLHDGALIIRGDTIEAAHAILPLTQQPEFAHQNIGTRHRAAIGVTEETDAVAVVVSEETGGISMAKRGSLKRFLTPDQLFELLTRELIDKPDRNHPDDFGDEYGDAEDSDDCE